MIPFEDPKIEAYFYNKVSDQQREQLLIIREAVLTCGIDLQETLKWGTPTYVGKSNVCGLAAFKHHIAIWFFQGVFLNDFDGVLEAAQDKTKALRQWRFSIDAIITPELVKKYVKEAALNDLDGKVMKPVKKAALPTPDYIKSFLKGEKLLDSFNKMSPSHRREFIEYVDEAKREETKLRRLKKMAALLQQGLDLNAKYRK
tara:strand:+ start:28497 stop:29099 length:603 start_codon:yes stop_codon:yes gene_type:complete